jgi:hypothetical protein
MDEAVAAYDPAALRDPTRQRRDLVSRYQVLDYIEDLLLAVSRRELHGLGELRDATGRLRPPSG